MRKIIFAIYTLVSGLSISALTQDQPLTLHDAIEIGLKNNYAIQISRNEAEIEANNYALGNAGFLPSIDVNASASKSIADANQEFITGNKIKRDGAETKSINGGVALSWTLFDGLRMFTTFGRLRDLKEMGEVQFKNELENTLAQIIIAYSDVVQQQLGIAALQDAVTISRERIRIARGKYNIGTESKLELNQATVAFNADSSALLRQEITLATAKVNLNELLNRDELLDFQTDDSLAIEKELAFENLYKMMMENNNLLALAKTDISLAQRNLRAYRAERLPELDLNASYNYSKSESDAGFLLTNETTSKNLALSLRMNLFNGFNTTRNIQNAKIEKRNSELNFESIKNQISAELATTFRRYQNSLQVVDLEQDNIKLARQNVDIALQQFRLGSITSVELRDVQNNFIESEARLIRAEFEAKVAETDLLRLSGQLIQ